MRAASDGGRVMRDGFNQMDLPELQLFPERELGKFTTVPPPTG
jgi:hypothetical protein